MVPRPCVRFVVQWTVERMVAWRSGGARDDDARGCHWVPRGSGSRAACPPSEFPEREARHVQQGTLRALFCLVLC